MRRRVIHRLGQTYVVDEPQEDELAERQSEDAQFIGLQIEALFAETKSLDPETRLKALFGATIYCALKHYGLTDAQIQESFKVALERAADSLAMEVS